ncbi:MAG TPA: adenosylcobinamide-GDP ribazoletransferase [Micromonosporaceae bacterium]
MIDGLRLALTTFTVIPIRGGPVTRPAASVAMAVTPLVGAVIGAVMSGVALLLTTAGASPLLTGVTVVACGVLLTRGLHVDGLADVLDALGSYATRERALAIMKRPDIGAFGVAGIVLALLGQVAAVAAIVTRGPLAVLAALVAAAATGRLAVTLACRRGVPAARTDGLGALVAGTVPWPVPAAWTVLFAAAALAVIPGRPWQGPLAVLAGLGAAALFTRHAVRRFGGVTGDVLGAALEIAVTLSLAFLALS